ncbi:MAG: hypothetical protein KIT33_00515 [Candidatus Kapabacteria bacterium]|nr:hypothetical protein [Ignavibacteriota bacterium]MCW5883431.1 hypothetical protein [Candidatus Kapabacteria bacterium]
MSKFQVICLISLFSFIYQNYSQEIAIPGLYINIQFNNGILEFVHPETNQILKSREYEPLITYNNIKNPATGTEKGFKFNFESEKINGKLYFGLYQINNSKFKYPIYLNKSVDVISGKCDIDIISYLSGIKDIANWQKTGNGKIGYRLVNEHGRILYDGKLNFTGKGPFFVVNHITEGPFINQVTENSAVVTFRTNATLIPTIEIDGKLIKGSVHTDNHEINITGLKPNTKYSYKIIIDDFTETYSFNTTPPKGDKSPFSFAFSSDSRSGFGGGERDLNGVNAYIMKKSAALALANDVKFFQFTGDLITGYLTSYDETLLQYSNWKRAIEPYAAFLPFYTGMGNHENILYNFDDGSNYGISINAFPFESNSSESAFSECFSNFKNGPASEDNSKYDINPNNADFPKYDDQVYHYYYGNTAMIVLNSDYLYAASSKALKFIGGNPHSYIMDNQLEWLEKVIEMYEKDNYIDHIFVTIHTPAFPNGGHSYDAMWYNGKNDARPYLFGVYAEKGIIERRDEFLDIICNKSSKVVALLTGDEHNYSRMLISQDMQRYPDEWEKDKLKIKNPVWQIVNGAAGAPYYGQENMPWSDKVEFFTSEHIICFFNIDGKNVTLRVFNPETLEFIEEVILK